MKRPILCALGAVALLVVSFVAGWGMGSLDDPLHWAGAIGAWCGIGVCVCFFLRAVVRDCRAIERSEKAALEREIARHAAAGSEGREGLRER